MPSVEKVWRIICWIISGVTEAAEMGTEEGEDMEEESVVSEDEAVMAR